MKSLIFTFGILITLLSSCKKTQTTLNELEGDWKIDRAELLDGPTGDSTFTDTHLKFSIGTCISDDNSLAGCQTSSIKIDDKTIFKEVLVQYQKGGKSLSVSSLNQEANAEDMERKKASLFAGGYTIEELTKNTLVLKSQPIIERDLGKFFFDYLDFKHSIRILRLKK